MKKVVVSGRTIEQAVKAGLSQWNVSEDRVKIRIIDQPSKGLFGFIGVKEAKVELEYIPDPIDQSIRFLEEVFEAMNAPVQVEKIIDHDGIVLNLKAPDLGILIGRRGQTLDALQYLVNIVGNRYATTHLRIILDAEDFRQRRRKTLEELSLRLAEKAIRTKKEVILEPMSSLERKIIHSQLQDHPIVKTFSKGDEPNRKVVIALK